jgi:hypothetical protein
MVYKLDMVESEYERGKPLIPFFPCLADPSKDCINCKFLGPNTENLRKLRWYQYVRYVFGHEVADDPPTIEQLIELLVRKDTRFAYIHSETFGRLIPMTPELKKLGNRIDKTRREFVNKMSRREELDLKCPVLENQESDLDNSDII